MQYEGTPPLVNLNSWLKSNSLLANSIKWQAQPSSVQPYGVYLVQEADKINWLNWSDAQKQDLAQAFKAHHEWYFTDYENGTDDIPTIPVNTIPLAPGMAPVCYVDPSYAWQLYVRWVAHALFLQAYQIVPWSIQSYTSEQLEMLLDSSRFMRRIPNGTFVMGFDHFTLSPERKQLFGATLIAPPIYTYKFASQFVPEPGIVPVTRLDAIISLLNWCKNNLKHFYGQLTVANCQLHWQNESPSFVKIVEGTNAGSYEYAKWTAGCGGTSSFISHALRALNIPVQLFVACSSYHYMPLFPTEQLFMTHGDNPYNSDFKASGLGVDALLLDAPQFQTLFGVDFGGILNAPFAPCSSVGLQYLFQ